MSDRHETWLDVDDGYCSVRVTCPYEMGDTSRPCWPHDEGFGPDGEWGPMPAPQDECVYKSWAENLAPDELLHGTISLALGTAVWSFDNDSARVTVSPVVVGPRPPVVPGEDTP